MADYAVTSNHAHMIVCLDSVTPLSWSDLSVARRWLSVYPRTYLSAGIPVLPSEAVIVNTAKEMISIGVWRKRLAAERIRKRELQRAAKAGLATHARHPENGLWLMSARVE